MALIYKVKKLVNPSSAMNGYYYGHAKMEGEINLEGIGELIERNCSMKKSDVMAVLTEMVEVMRDNLQDSKRVRIDGLGIFRLGIRSNCVEKAEEFRASDIKSIHVNFLPQYTVNVDGSRTVTLTDGCKLAADDTYTPGVNDNEQ